MHMHVHIHVARPIHVPLCNTSAFNDRSRFNMDMFNKYAITLTSLR